MSLVFIRESMKRDLFYGGFSFRKRASKATGATGNRNYYLNLEFSDITLLSDRATDAIPIRGSVFDIGIEYA